MPRRKMPMKKRRGTRKRVQKSRMVRIPRVIGPPKSMLTRLRWNHTYQASVAPGATAVRDFRLNSLFDPDLSGTGDQPHYFDQYSALYARYRVYAAKWHLITTCSCAVSDLYHPMLTITSWGDVSPSWNTTAALSSKRSIRKYLIPGQESYSIKRYFNMSSILGVPKREYNIAEPYQALVTANPARQAVLNIGLINNSATSSITWSFNLQVIYYVKFFDNQEPTGS